MSALTVKEALAWAKAKLEQSHIDDAALDAALLLEYATDLDRTGLILQENRLLTEMEATVFSAGLEKRLAGCPTQYILGEWEFMGLPFSVDERVLIPRPDTELLVEQALAAAPKRAVDLGTGSGCIAVSLAYYGNTEVYAVDVSRAALDVARENARKNHVEHIVTFLEGDLFAPLPEQMKGSLDLVASNPPYIAKAELPELMREVREHEPLLALDGGCDGLNFYRRIVPEAYVWLRPGGMLCLEIGWNQGRAVKKLLEDSGFCGVAVLPSLAGLDRVVKGVKHV